jgi:hypothetical protein
MSQNVNLGEISASSNRKAAMARNEPQLQSAKKQYEAKSDRKSEAKEESEYEYYSEDDYGDEKAPDLNKVEPKISLAAPKIELGPPSQSNAAFSVSAYASPIKQPTFAKNQDQPEQFKSISLSNSFAKNSPKSVYQSNKPGISAAKSDYIYSSMHFNKTHHSIEKAL